MTRSSLPRYCSLNTYSQHQSLNRLAMCDLKPLYLSKTTRVALGTFNDCIELRRYLRSLLIRPRLPLH